MKSKSKNSMDSNVSDFISNVPHTFPPPILPNLRSTNPLFLGHVLLHISDNTSRPERRRKNCGEKLPEITKTNSPAAFASFRKMSWELKEKLLYHTFVKGFVCSRCQHESIQVILKGYHMVQCLRCETASHQASGRLCEYRNSLSKMCPGS